MRQRKGEGGGGQEGEDEGKRDEERESLRERVSWRRGGGFCIKLSLIFGFGEYILLRERC